MEISSFFSPGNSNVAVTVFDSAFSWRSILRIAVSIVQYTIELDLLRIQEALDFVILCGTAQALLALVEREAPSTKSLVPEAVPVIRRLVEVDRHFEVNCLVEWSMW
jgi:hypothetical protein